MMIVASSLLNPLSYERNQGCAQTLVKQVGLSLCAYDCYNHSHITTYTLKIMFSLVNQTLTISKKFLRGWILIIFFVVPYDINKRTYFLSVGPLLNFNTRNTHLCSLVTHY